MSLFHLLWAGNNSIFALGWQQQYQDGSMFRYFQELRARHLSAGKLAGKHASDYRPLCCCVVSCLQRRQQTCSQQQQPQRPSQQLSLRSSSLKRWGHVSPSCIMLLPLSALQLRSMGRLCMCCHLVGDSPLAHACHLQPLVTLLCQSSSAITALLSASGCGLSIAYARAPCPHRSVLAHHSP